MSESNAIVNRRGKWSLKGVPHKGWECVDCEDLGEPAQTCEMCESTEIRYVHVMRHPDFETELRVGCVCAEHLSEGYVGKENERRLRNYAKRRSRFLNRKWKTSRSGNPKIELNDYPITIFEKVCGWKYVITVGFFKPWAPDESPESIFSDRTFKTKDDAKLAAFDHVMRLGPRYQNHTSKTQ